MAGWAPHPSTGRVLSRFHELKEEVLTFLATQHSELADFLGDKLWFNKVAFLADFFQSLNTLNKSIQGDHENILTCTYKITTFKEKLMLWERILKRENVVEMLELTKRCKLDGNLILQTLRLLGRKIEKHFPSPDISTLDCIRDLFVLPAYKLAKLKITEGDKLTEIRNDQGLKLKHSATDTTSFWLSLKSEFASITTKSNRSIASFLHVIFV